MTKLVINALRRRLRPQLSGLLQRQPFWMRILSNVITSSSQWNDAGALQIPSPATVHKEDEKIVDASPEEIPGYKTALDHAGVIVQWCVAIKASAQSLAYLQQLEGETIQSSTIDNKPICQQIEYLIDRMKIAERDRNLSLCNTIENLQLIADRKLKTLPPYRVLGMQSATHANGLNPEVAAIYYGGDSIHKLGNDPLYWERRHHASSELQFTSFTFDFEGGACVTETIKNGAIVPGIIDKLKRWLKIIDFTPEDCPHHICLMINLNEVCSGSRTIPREGKGSSVWPEIEKS